MSSPFVPGVGGILSADIAVPEHEREVAFYSRVLTTGEHPLWRDDLMNNRGTPIIGLGARIPAYEMLPLQWMPHIQVSDVARSAARALELGGTELMHSKDESGSSQWAVLVDRDGAAFGIMPVVPAESIPQGEGDASSAPGDRVGHIAGFSLAVSGAPAARDFYRQVAGWSVQDVEIADASEPYVDFDMLRDDGHAAATVRNARGANAGLPPVWLMHRPVGDLAESLRRVRDGGGQVLRANQRADGTHASAVIQDPVGVCLALIPG